MLKRPAYGFAKRVDDTVARAMTILHSREDFTAKRSQRTPAAEHGETSPREQGSSGTRRIR
jgi:hypothetical protein